jgi:S-adenosylmethionine synthetase
VLADLIRAAAAYVRPPRLFPETSAVSRSNYIFTSESVSEGHPDKVADRISDTVVDAFLSAEPEARVACETLVTTNRIVLAGEVRAGRPGGSKAESKALTRDIIKSLEPKVRQAIKDIGYEQKGFHWAKAKYACHLHAQSAHIAQGVDANDKKDEGAGDQGIMFGYACDETPSLMPATLQYSHDILRKLAEVRHSGECHVLEPDAKSQVTLRYEDGRPVEVLQIVVSTQHKKRIGLHIATPKRIEQVIRPYVESVFPAGLITKKTKWHVNPTGRFEIGGPDGDAGLTGRKIIVDTYGGAAPHGGGAFSGKDPTKVDRSAAYACRYLAKNVVAAGLARKCTIQISYAIGVAQPLSFYVDLHNTGEIDPAKLELALPEMIGGATPRAIREHLGLNKPIYARTAAYGHFGRQPDNEGGFSWERPDLAEELKKLA